MEIVSYEFAKQNGLKRYFTGVPCRKGHLSERRTSKKSCIECSNIWQKENMKNNPDYKKRQRESIKKRMQIHYKNEDYKIKRREKAKEYYYKNIDYMRSKARKSMKKKLSKLDNRLSENISYYIWRFVSKSKGVGRSKRIKEKLGWDIKDLKSHLECQFTNGMNWDNYGRNGWHIDHIIPKSSFNLSNESEFIACWQLSNLRPLWGIENKIKSNKIQFLI